MTTLQPDTLIKNPHGCHVVSSVEVPADAPRVWEVVGNFAGFDKFIPALSHIEMTGEGVTSLRKKFFKDGNLVVEQLNSRDDQALSMTWTTIYNTLGVANLWAAMTVEPLGRVNPARPGPSSPNRLRVVPMRCQGSRTSFRALPMTR